MTHKIINSIWNKEVLPQHWKEPIIIPVYKKGDNLTNNYRGISLISNILVLRLTPYVDEIIEYHQCGF